VGKSTAAPNEGHCRQAGAPKGGGVMAMSDEQLAEYFRYLENPVQDLGAMVEIVMLVWRENDNSAMNTNRMHVALDKLEPMVRAFVDDYRAKLNGRWAAEHEAQ
jgi:hypothetical protein